jgi:hypothetical protein
MLKFKGQESIRDVCNARWMLKKQILCIFGCPRFRFDKFGVGFVVPFH